LDAFDKQVAYQEWMESKEYFRLWEAELATEAVELLVLDMNTISTMIMILDAKDILESVTNQRRFNMPNLRCCRMKSGWV
jgi:hypothetical protein